MVKKISLSRKAFNEGVDEVLTLSPLRKAFKDMFQTVAKGLETMPTMHEMNKRFIKQVRQLGKF